jgi:hypothetical protein
MADESETIVPPTSDEIPVPYGAGFDFADPNSPLAPYYLKTVHLLAIAFLGVVFVLATHFPLWHTDVWGHMKYGQWMVEHGRIPDREPFCPWWDGRVPFTQYYTWTQLVMYGGYAGGAALAGGDEVRRMAGGVEMLRLEHALLTVARFAVMLLVFLRAGGSWRVALLGLVAVAFLDLSNLAVFRPQTFAQLLFALLLVPLTRPVLSRRGMVLIPLLAVLWANGHGSYVVLFALLGTVLLGRTIECLTASPRVAPWYDPQVIRLGVTLAASLVGVGLLNPYGFELYTRTVQLAGHPSLQMAVTEWQPLTFAWDRGWHWVYMGSLVVIALTQLACKTPIQAGHLTLLVVFGIGAALQNRFLIWWAMLVPWVLVPRWVELARDWPARWTPAPSVPTFRKTAIAAVLLFATFTWSGPAGWVMFGNPAEVETAVSKGTPWQVARQVSRPNDPAAAWNPELAEVIKTRYPGGKFTGTIMATPMQGDYLMWALAPDVPVTYAHIHLFHPDYWDELGVVGRGDPGWADVLDKYRVNLLVVEADYATKLREHLKNSKTWKVLLDEHMDAAAKPEPLTRQLIAVRLNPL